METRHVVTESGITLNDILEQDKAGVSVIEFTGTARDEILEKLSSGFHPGTESDYEWVNTCPRIIARRREAKSEGMRFGYAMGFEWEGCS